MAQQRDCPPDEVNGVPHVCEHALPCATHPRFLFSKAVLNPEAAAFFPACSSVGTRSIGASCSLDPTATDFVSGVLIHVLRENVSVGQSEPCVPHVQSNQLHQN